MIFFFVPDDKSMHLNMIGGSWIDHMGTLEISYCNYDSPRRPPENFDLEPKNGLTVGQVLALLYEKGRDRYEFTGGVGCRFWV